ncbi:MAG: NAD(P)H-dependent oxidoreductase [Saccharospirillaceae bacterium]|nr:NAD(P)H-dependent oxidoreductase [Pseudomonadales bacterium]NRB80090.1 NAD(P)H-dependent oxidoreductase [Saccharospirillaceae bacterium]
MEKILHIDTSAALINSSSRTLSKAIVDKLNAQTVTYNDISAGLPVLSEAHIQAGFTPIESRTAEQKETLTLSDALVDQLIEHDVIVIGVPMYNFGIPASLKLYIDLIARVGRTFKYTETGPKGLLDGKKVYFALTSGGVPLNIGLPVDHVTGQLKTFFDFIGITDQEFITASGLASNAEKGMNDAMQSVLKIA